MTHQERTQIGELWLVVASMYGKDISKGALKLMLDSVSDLPAQRVLQALAEWTKSSETRSHPLPVDIRKAINPPVDDKLLAIDLARKIDKACINHGYHWQQGYYGADGFYWLDDKNQAHSSFKEAVISELGALGWHAICARGGWEQVALSANEMQEGTFIAQLREQVQAAITLQRQGVDVAQIEMPNRGELTGSSRSGDLVRLDFSKRPEGA